MSKINFLPIVMLLLSGCSLSPEYVRPDVTMPDAERWVSEAHAEQSLDDITQWWKNFESDELNKLLEQSLEYNTDLKAGLYRVEQSRASLKAAGATLFPSMDASMSTSRLANNPSNGDSSHSTALGLGVSVSYEVDLFGANRAALDSAKADYEGTIYDQGALKLTVIGDVATGYFTLVNLHERLEIADENLNNASEILRIIQSRVQAGAESELELAQQKVVVASSEASRESIVEQILNAQNALAVLLGQPPGTINIKVSSLNDIKIPVISVGQPSELLHRRPDILSIESALYAANADIGVARAALYPSISLGISDSLSLTGFGDPSSTAFSLSSSLVAPIFSAGALEAQVDRVTSRQLELVENYRGSIYIAFQEVEDALVALNTAQIREDALKVAMQHATHAYNLSKSRYDAGAIDYQTVLDTQNSKLSAQDSYAQVKLARLIAAVTLYRTLGGGWNS